MSSVHATVAAAFSTHRFSDALPHLAPTVRWHTPGRGTLKGRDAVVAACETTTAELAGVTTNFSRLVVADGGDVVAVDAVGVYRDADGMTSQVSSCDVYEFVDDVIVAITSYATEV